LDYRNIKKFWLLEVSGYFLKVPKSSWIQVFAKIRIKNITICCFLYKIKRSCSVVGVDIFLLCDEFYRCYIYMKGVDLVWDLFIPDEKRAMDVFRGIKWANSVYCPPCHSFIY
jgi:hypothetical protein